MSDAERKALEESRRLIQSAQRSGVCAGSPYYKRIFDRIDQLLSPPAP